MLKLYLEFQETPQPTELSTHTPIVTDTPVFTPTFTPSLTTGIIDKTPTSIQTPLPTFINTETPKPPLLDKFQYLPVILSFP